MVKIFDITIPKLTCDAPRKAYVYLPDSYDQDPSRRYPVMYMFDGHNVFFDQHATYGKSWGMKEYMDQTQKQMIIVAVECNHHGFDRLSEYSPFDFSFGEVGAIKGQGRAYMNWLTKVLKPQIDAEYRTLSDRKNTIIAGSSMGGLMSLYAVCAFNQVFGRAACLSPSLWTNPMLVKDMIRKRKLRKDTVIYMDYGSKELPGREINKSILSESVAILIEKDANVTFRIVPGGTHCEASWERQIPIFMSCLDI